MPLGALFEDAVEALERAGLDVAPLRDAGRRLVVEAGNGTTYITTRPSDVPTYVESGAADLGIVGKDVLRERSPDVYELLDLGFGDCRMVYATSAGEDPTPAALEHLGVVRVATKYPVDRHRPLHGHRPPGRGRQGERLGGAGAAGRAWPTASSTSSPPAAPCARTAWWSARRSSAPRRA